MLAELWALQLSRPIFFFFCGRINFDCSGTGLLLYSFLLSVGVWTESRFSQILYNLEVGKTWCQKKKDFKIQICSSGYVFCTVVLSRDVNHAVFLSICQKFPSSKIYILWALRHLYIFTSKGIYRDDCIFIIYSKLAYSKGKAKEYHSYSLGNSTEWILTETKRRQKTPTLKGTSFWYTEIQVIQTPIQMVFLFACFW